MKVVINKRFGGFGLSPLAVEIMAKRLKRACYFFVHARDASGNLDLNRFSPASKTKLGDELCWYAFDIPNPDDLFVREKNWSEMSEGERQIQNQLYDSHSLPTRGIARNDPTLVAVVEQLGEMANGRFADLKVIEIPDDVEWEIDEYDGMESIHEKHQTWG